MLIIEMFTNNYHQSELESSIGHKMAQIDSLARKCEASDHVEAILMCQGIVKMAYEQNKARE